MKAPNLQACSKEHQQDFVLLGKRHLVCLMICMSLMHKRRHRIAQSRNSALVILNCQIGHGLRTQILKEERAYVRRVDCALTECRIWKLLWIGPSPTNSF